MSAQLIDGRALSEEVLQEVADEVAVLKQTRGVTPGLAALLVGHDPPSRIYVRNKQRASEKVGILAETFELPAAATEASVLEQVRALNEDDRFHGVLVQLPLPAQIRQAAVAEAVSPDKDVDGMHPATIGRLVSGLPAFVPATPLGIQEMLIRSGHSPTGKHVVICGRSDLVGKPLALLLMTKSEGANATVTVCHTGTADLARFTRQAEILVAAIGSPGFITEDMVAPGAVVVDVGINRVRDPSAKNGYRLAGDVDFEQVREVAAAITPVPGGVGPMTVATLMANTVRAARSQTKADPASARRSGVLARK